MGRGKKWVMLVAGNAGKLRSEVQNAETDLERIISGYIIRNPASGECQDELHLDSARGSFINSVQLHMHGLSDGFIDEIRVKRRAGDNSCGTSGKWLALCNANTLTENIVGSLRWFTPVNAHLRRWRWRPRWTWESSSSWRRSRSRRAPGPPPSRRPPRRRTTRTWPRRLKGKEWRNGMTNRRGFIAVTRRIINVWSGSEFRVG